MPPRADHLISVEEVRSRADLKAFVDLPRRLHRGNPDFVMPLNRDIRGRLDRRHPYFAHAEAALFLARRRGEVVGRIAATVNHAHNEYHREQTGFFGFFECVREFEVSGALLDAAAAWLKARRQVVMRGPASFSSNDEFGLFVEGDPGPPCFMMPWNPTWYGALLEGAGMAKAMDLVAWEMHDHDDLPRWERLAQRVTAREGVVVRALDMKRFQRDVEIIRDLYADAWSANWGFVPMTRAEFDALAKDLRAVVIPDLVLFVMKGGREAGFLFALPDLNEIIRHLDGRLFPFGIVRLLRGRHHVRRARIAAMGVRRDLQGRGLDVLLYHHIAKNCGARGIRTGELGWVLETNAPMNNTLRRAGCRISRRYRIYERPL